METLRLETDQDSIEKAGEIIREGGLIAFPTETVYGLGANAYDARAVKSVYSAKGRPGDNPMIVHIAHFDQLEDVVSEVPDIGRQLIEVFWPGPLTIIMEKNEDIPGVTTGGLDTVGVRMPSNRTASAFLHSCRVPVAAPSANLSGKPSPTTWEDVLEDMDGRINGVLMGEPCDVGIESTVIDVTGEHPVILRPGFITAEMITRSLGLEVTYDPALFQDPAEKGDFHPKAPGMKYKHYAPKAQVQIVEGDEEKALAMIASLSSQAQDLGKKTALIDYGRDSRAAAKDFFSRLRELDRENVDIIYVYALPEKELGFSVMNRMLKSAGYNVIHV